MEVDKAIEFLTTFVIMDRNARLRGNYSTELDKFMEDKCVAIETLIEYIENNKNK